MLSKKNFQKTTVKFFLPEYKTVFIGKGMIFLILLLLIAFSNGPILKAQNPEWKVYNTSNSGLPNNVVNCIAIDSSGNIWIGTTKGLAKYNGASTEGTGWTVYNTSNSGLPDNLVKCLAADKIGNMWIGTTKGLAKYDGASTEETGWTVYNTSNTGLPENDVECLSVEGNGNIWIGIWGRGLVKYDGTNWIIYDTSNSGLPDNLVKCLTVDGSGNIWTGTTKGLAKYDGASTEGTGWTVYNTSNSGLPENYFSCLVADESGDIWIGTGWDYEGFEVQVSGLVKYDGTNWIVYDTSNSGLPDNLLKCLTVDDSGNIWIGTGDRRGYGLARYDGTSPEGTGWTVYNTSNSGLPDNLVKCLNVDGSGNMWIGTWGGLAVFNEGGIVSSINSEGNKEDYPDKFILSQNYPNPFNPSTKIKYTVASLNASQGGTFVQLKIYDILGREIAVLVNEKQKAGYFEIKWDAGNQPSGVYFYRISAGEYVETKKMLLLK